ncbi:MAG: leucyl aminopeptidase family protein, partial [Planctomycetota bacterium]
MTRITVVADAQKAAAEGSPFDCVLLTGHDLKNVSLKAIDNALRAAATADAGFEGRTALWPAPGAAGSRLVCAPTGPLHRDYDDVRRYADAAEKGIRLARAAGARSILLVVQGAPKDSRYVQAAAVAAQAALGALWEPLEAREALGESAMLPVKQIGVAALDGSFSKDDAGTVAAIDEGAFLCKDLCGTDPERMAPKRFADHVQKALRGTGVKVTVVSTPATLQKDYPLLAAVARASMPVARHRPCVVRLEYDGGGKPERTLLFAGKGLTYDTGGADLKVGGHMAGMCRDKGGAAAVAGLFLAAARLKVKGVHLIAELGVVRNSIGSDSYVADEIIESHAGARVRVGNTDAEGRMVLADLLSHLRIRAKKAKAPHLYSVATLTGHAVRAVGPYSIALDNGPARAQLEAETLQMYGELSGDPFEVTRLRREDWDFVAPTSKAWDVLQCNNLPSSGTPRGHQFPMAFLCIASGLAAHGSDSKEPLPYTHVD